VTLGLCTQIDLDAEVQKAADRAAREGRAAGTGEAPGGSLLPTAETTDSGIGASQPAEPAEEAPSHAEEEARMFAKLSSMSSGEANVDAAEPIETAENVFSPKPSPASEAPTAAEEPNDAFEAAQASSEAVETPEQAEGDPPPVTEAMTGESSEAPAAESEEPDNGPEADKP